jgi:hypothetical protein
MLVYEFRAARGRFEGALLGALERTESGGAIRVVEVLFLARIGEPAELAVLRLKGGGGSLVTRLSEFRLDARRRRELTEEALAGPEGEVLEELGAVLEPGDAVVAITLEHAWSRALADAVARTGGDTLSDEQVELDASGAARRVLDAVTLARAPAGSHEG